MTHNILKVFFWYLAVLISNSSPVIIQFVLCTCIFYHFKKLSREEGKYQEAMQSSAIPDMEHHMEK